jgi:hypothetical protein
VNNTTMSFEQYAAWAISRYPGYRGEPDPISEAGVTAAAPTEAPKSSDACPVTVRSSRDRVIVTPHIKRSV